MQKKLACSSAHRKNHRVSSVWFIFLWGHGRLFFERQTLHSIFLAENFGRKNYPHGYPSRCILCIYNEFCIEYQKMDVAILGKLVTHIKILPWQNYEINQIIANLDATSELPWLTVSMWKMLHVKVIKNYITRRSN